LKKLDKCKNVRINGFYKNTRLKTGERMNVVQVVMHIVSFLAISLLKIYEKGFLETAIAYFLA